MYTLMVRYINTMFKAKGESQSRENAAILTTKSWWGLKVELNTGGTQVSFSTHSIGTKREQAGGKSDVQVGLRWKERSPMYMRPSNLSPITFSLHQWQGRDLKMMAGEKETQIGSAKTEQTRWETKANPGKAGSWWRFTVKFSSGKGALEKHQWVLNEGSALVKKSLLGQPGIRPPCVHTRMHNLPYMYTHTYSHYKH